jgi:hypothetical protein
MPDHYEIRPTDRRRRVERSDDAMKAAKHWRGLVESGVPSELCVNGGRAPTDEQAAPVYKALEQLNDELQKVVIFKNEDDWAGVPQGPVTVGPDPDLVVLCGDALLAGEPWWPPCLCEPPRGEPGKACSKCGGKIQAWVTLPEAEEMARELGLEVRET